MKRLSRLLLAALAATGMGIVSAAGTTTDLRSELAAGHVLPVAPSAPVTPLAVCDVGTPDLIVHDDGSGENGYGWNASANVGRIAEKFTPEVYPATIGTVCVAFITNSGAASLNFNLVVYAADGPDGGPGTELGSKPLVSHPTAVSGLPFTPTFEAFDISDLDINIESGSVFISTEWDAAVEPGGVFLGADESPGTPINGGMMRANEDPWEPIADGNDEYRAMLMRATMPASGPGAPSLSKAFAPSQVLAGEDSVLTITLRNTTQDTPAVLSADLVDTLPVGLVVADDPDAATTCDGGTVVADPATGSVSLQAGAGIPAEGTCTITVKVTSDTDGTYQNVIPAGALQTNHGDNAAEAAANLKVGFIFPEPYCPVTFPSAVEPITRVVFADIDNSSPATGGPAHQDFTAIIGNVVPGESVDIRVEGNTSGDFTTPIVAYIDWNQDGVFDPVTEKYTVGSLKNSTGTDGKFVSTTITVPEDALSGNTRMRVLKRFSTEAPPCNNAGYGQAEDYTLSVAPASPAPKVAKAFAPAQVAADTPSTLTITLRNLDNSTDAVLTAPFTDTFPAGLVIADTPNASTTCGSGAVTATAGAGSVTLETGAVIPGDGTCEVTVDVQSSTDGSYVNVIEVGDLQTDQGENPFAANATLKVGFTFPEPYCPVTFPSGIEPITRVEFAGFDNTSPASSTIPLEDFTAIVGDVVPDDVVSIRVEGNTSGNFKTQVKVYIDWNQDGTFDPVTEAYYIGQLENSTGTDGKFVTADIAVPADALPGATRMRVTKKFGSSGEASAAPPCNNAGFGQAEDYTVLVGPPVPKVSKAFAPTEVEENENSTLTITIANPTAADATLTAPLVDNLPAGMTVSHASTSCGLIIGDQGAVISASTITLPAGVVLPAGSTCAITATVQAADAGTYDNVIPAGALQTDQGNSTREAAATLIVVEPFVDPVITVNPASLGATHEGDDVSTATLTIGNTGVADLVWSIVEEAAGVVVPNATTLLFDQTAGSTTTGSVAFLDLDEPDFYETEAADDFTVPAGQTWSVTRVMADGFAQPPAAPTVSANVSIYADAGGAPGAPVASFPGLSPAADDGGALTMELPSAVVLTAGTYWVSVQPERDWFDDGPWYWRQNASGTGAEFHWRNPGDGFETGCETWGSATDCLEADNVNLTFQIWGEITDGTPPGCDADDIPWLSVSPSSGTTAPGASDVVTVSFDSTGLATGSYSGNLCIANNDPARPIVNVPVSLTVTGPSGTPIAEVTPPSFDFTVDEGDTGADTMVIGNIGGGILEYSIHEAEFERNPPSFRNTLVARYAPGTFDPEAAFQTSSHAVSGVGEPVILEATDIAQMEDNVPVPLNGVSCGSDAGGAADNSWWRRFYFDEHENVTWPTVAINSVTVASETGVATPVTINVYTIPATVPVDTIDTSQLTLIGTGSGMVGGELTTTTVAISPGAVVDDPVGKNLVVEYHIDAGAGLPRFFPGGNPSPETHTTFMSSNACSITEPTPAANIGGGFPDFHIIMVVNVDEGPAPHSCDNPTDVPWLSANPLSGSLLGGESDDITVTVDASALAPGEYAANLCITTNDPTAALIPVPVTLTVESTTPDDRIFCSGFEDREDGMCGTLPPGFEDIVFSGPINHPIAETIYGTSVNWITGEIEDDAVSGAHFNPYDTTDQLSFWWGTGAPDVAGVASAADTSDYLVLQSGAVVGPASTWSTESLTGPAAWAAGANGYLGVRFNCSALDDPPAGGICYGYVRLETTGPTGFPATIVEYAYNKAGDPIIVP